MRLLVRKNGDTDIENKHVDTEREKVGRMNQEIGINVYTVICIK